MTARAGYYLGQDMRRRLQPPCILAISCYLSGQVCCADARSALLVRRCLPGRAPASCLLRQGPGHPRDGTRPFPSRDNDCRVAAARTRLSPSRRRLCAAATPCTASSWRSCSPSRPCCEHSHAPSSIAASTMPSQPFIRRRSAVRQHHRRSGRTTAGDTSRAAPHEHFRVIAATHLCRRLRHNRPSLQPHTSLSDWPRAATTARPSLTFKRHR